MKLKILSLSMLLPVLTVLISCTGCENGLFNSGSSDYQDHTWEIQLNDDQKVIEQTVKGIEFKFCLLNEDSVPSTTFQEGENFYFYFLITNKNNENILLDVPVVNTEFFYVYEIINEEIIDKGTPIQGAWCEYSSMPDNYDLEPNDRLTFKHPWLLLSEDGITDYYPFCSKPNNPGLKKGIYYTKFPAQINYSNKGSVHADSLKLTLKINFEIK